MYLDYNKIEEEGFDKELLEEVFQSVKNFLVVCSFSNTAYDNMPMWAHYANNHQGFCVEYNVKNPRLIFKVLYEENREPVATFIYNLHIILMKLKSGEIDENDKEYIKYVQLILFNSLIKHKGWDYENEYRIIYFNPSNEEKGKIISNKELDLETSKILIGKNCSETNRDRLIGIARKRNIAIADVDLDEHANSFALVPKEIKLDFEE